MLNIYKIYKKQIKERTDALRRILRNEEKLDIELMQVYETRNILLLLESTGDLSIYEDYLDYDVFKRYQERKQKYGDKSLLELLVLSNADITEFYGFLENKLKDKVVQNKVEQNFIRLLEERNDIDLLLDMYTNELVPDSIKLKILNSFKTKLKLAKTTPIDDYSLNEYLVDVNAGYRKLR